MTDVVLVQHGRAHEVFRGESLGAPAVAGVPADAPPCEGCAGEGGAMQNGAFVVCEDCGGTRKGPAGWAVAPEAATGMHARFHRSLVAQMIEVPEGAVNEGDVYDAASGTFAQPPAPPPPSRVPYDQFRARWQPNELQALHAAKQSDWRIEDFVNLAIAQNHIYLTGPTAGQARALFVELGVLTAERAAEIFS